MLTNQQERDTTKCKSNENITNKIEKKCNGSRAGKIGI
jgi:hypothetical protein